MADETKRKLQPSSWEKGVHGDQAVIIIETAVCLMMDGGVFSTHNLQDPTDQAVVMTWPGGGQEHVAFSMLLEAVRREALLALLLKASEKEGTWAPLLDESNDDAVADELVEGLKQQMAGSIERVAKNSILEAIQMMRTAFHNQKPDN